MNKLTANTMLCTVLSLVTSLALADETRQLDAHQHGVAKMDLVVEGQTINIHFVSPAMNIVGFEHAPENPTQHALVENAKQSLGTLSGVIELPDQAECVLAQNSVEWIMESSEHDEDKHDEDKHDEDKHDEDKHDEDKHDEDKHDEDKHDEDKHDEDKHDEDKHDEDKHDEDKHDEDKHDEDKHDEEEHDKHDEHETSGTHSEFEAEYVLECKNIDNIQSISVALFDQYQGLEEIALQAILPMGQTAMKLTPTSNTISLK